ncbi:MAG: bifunctional adenosylcobinamide kinase/adenosylcobinamide-phosphate guanylyltransferase [Pleurocapsa sp.]
MKSTNNQTLRSLSLNTKQIILVTGASRSGKSEWAEKLATQIEKSVVYVATAMVDSTDSEWQARIIQHQQRRPQTWQTIVASKELAATVERAKSDRCLLIDSVGTWVANFLDVDLNSWQTITDDLLTSLQTTKADAILVGEETGWGVVPPYKSGRLFRDRLGHLLRELGNIADTVYLVTGGHALNLSLLGTPLDK